MTSRFVNLLGGNTHYTEHGNGRHVVLCLHGNSSSADAFAHFSNALPPAFRLICVDFPGHGRSDGADAYQPFFSFQGLATFVVGLVKALDIEPVAIVGHSMGGHVAAQLLPHLPSLRALLLISSPPIAGAAALPRFFQKNAPTDLIFARTLDSPQVHALARAFANADSPIEALTLIERDIRRTDGVFREVLGVSLNSATVEDELATVRSAPAVRIALLGGSLDRFIERGYYNWVADELELTPQDALVVDAAGHYPHLEAPQVTIDFFGRFLQRIETGTVSHA